VRLFYALVLLLIIIPSHAYAARFVAIVPQGITEVKLLSPGTGAVLSFLKERLDTQLKTSSETHQVDKLEKEAAQALLSIAHADKSYSERIDSLRKQYIEKIPITIHSASNQITQESALGDITFFFTAHNTSNMIISDITYKPVIEDIALPITTSLVLEFINPKNLIFGLAPGESLSNQGNEPEHFSFFLSELKEHDIKRIHSSMPGGFSIRVTDVHFVSQKGYKGQTKVMDIKEAFPGILSSFRLASQRARDDSNAKTDALSRARDLYENETKESMREFRAKAYDLRRTSVRYKGVVDQRKNRVSIEAIKPGSYIVYAASKSGKAFYREMILGEGTNKLKIQTLTKDPFEP
jgi:hypothetical protein